MGVDVDNPSPMIIAGVNGYSFRIFPSRKAGTNIYLVLSNLTGENSQNMSYIALKSPLTCNHDREFLNDVNG